MQILGDAKNMFRRGNPFLKREVCSNAQAGELYRILLDNKMVEPKGKSSNQKQNALHVVSKFALRGGVASRGIEPLLAGKANKPHVAYFFYFFKW